VRDVEAHVRVLTGRVSVELLELLRQERPDLVVAGTRALRGAERLLAPRLRHTLLTGAPCPVMLVRTAPAPDRQPVVLFCGRAASRKDPSFAAAGALAVALRWRLVRCPTPARRRDAAALNAVLAACREHRPGFAVIAGERCHWLRSRLGTSGSAALIDAAPCPVVVVSPAARPAPIARGSPRQALPAMASSQPLNDRQPALDGGIDAKGPDGRAEQRRSLLWQLFAANALVLAGATLVLILAPVSVSRDVVLTEVLILSAGLAVMLAVNLVLLGRTLAPLRLLTDVMGAIDPRAPRPETSRQRNPRVRGQGPGGRVQRDARSSGE
jgi:nucleotide-binding universal stress UspA family protein